MKRLNLATLALVAFLADPTRADEVRWDARSLYVKSVIDNLRLTQDGSGLELEQGELLEDDGATAGFSYKSNEEKLSGTIWIKKEFELREARTRSATLLVGPGGKLQAILNGKPQVLQVPGKAGNYWQAYQVPPDSLRPGRNEIILHGAGKVWIARDDDVPAGAAPRNRLVRRSGKSSDGGKTWSNQGLGAKGDVEGEYCVRLFLDRYRGRGTLTLPVLDVGNLTGEPVAAPLTSPGPVRVTVRAETGPESQVHVRARSGSTFAPTDKSWTVWQDLGARGMLDKPAGRFLQIALDLATDNPLATPILKEVLVQTHPIRTVSWTSRLKLIESQNPTIVRSSLAFRHEPFDHPRLKMLRASYKLDDVVKGAKGEFELITRLAAWSAQQWQRGHLREAYPPWDALEILKPHADGGPVGGFCQQYNVVFLQACASFGIPGRAVSLGPGDHGARIRSGHEVVEVWSNDHRRWVHVDGQTARYYADERTGTPLSLLELRARQLAVLQGQKAPPVKLVKLADTGHDWQGLESFPPFLELRLIPRSNFLEEAAPLPLNQGMRGWFWTGHHVWTDDRWPASLLYGQRVSSRGNWEWTLNQVHLVLEATDSPGVVRVHLDTETPGFETYLAQIDGEGKRPVTAGFAWRLHTGRNRLEVWPRNKAGREGIPSRVILEQE